MYSKHCTGFLASSRLNQTRRDVGLQLALFHGRKVQLAEQALGLEISRELCVRHLPKEVLDGIVLGHALAPQVIWRYLLGLSTDEYLAADFYAFCGFEGDDVFVQMVGGFVHGRYVVWQTILAIALFCLRRSWLNPCIALLVLQSGLGNACAAAVT